MRGHQIGRCMWCSGIGLRQLSRGSTSLSPAMVERHPPRHADEPGAKAVAIAQCAEPPVGPGIRLLRDILRILPMAEHAERDTEGKRGRLGEPGLELTIEVLLHVYEFPGQPRSKVVHCFV